MRASPFLLALLLAVLPALLTGCMQTKETVKIQKDGKGTITLDTVVDKQMTEAMVEMMNGMGYGGGMGSDPTARLDPDRIKKSLAGKEGIEVRSATRTFDEETGKITMRLEIAFDTIQALYDSGAVMGVGAKLEKLEDGNYQFTRSLFAEQLPKEGDLESQQMFEGILMMMQPYLEGMRFDAEFTLPTPIVETSGERVDERQVRWTIGFGDLVKPAKRTQTVVFSGEGLEWEPFESKAANPFERQRPATPTGPITPSEGEGRPEPEPKPEPKPESDGTR
jgi:hypothetical protein